ncbi:MAG: UbiA family prenyltransferase [Promethearchaeota archaeon]
MITFPAVFQIFQPSTLKKISELIRIEHEIMAAIGGITGILLAAKIGSGSFDIVTWADILFGMIVPALITSGAFGLNDYYDMEIDRINKRFDRPLVRGELNPEAVLWGSYGVIILGCLLCLHFGPLVFILTTVFGILSILYSYNLKDTGLIGNLIVTFSYAAPWGIGAVVILEKYPETRTATNEITIVALVGMALSMGLGREILKGIMDMEGDNERNIRTVALTRGPRFAAVCSVTLIFIGIGISIIPFFHGFKNNPFYLVTIMIPDVLLAYASIPLLFSQEYSIAKRGRVFSLIAFVFGTVAILVGTLTQ